MPSLTTLTSLTATSGNNIWTAGLIADAAGDLFGTTFMGGAYGGGTVFEIPYIDGSYATAPTTLVSLDAANQNGMSAGLIVDAAGNLFGTTFMGGAYNDGTVFEIAKTGGSYASTPTTLVSFVGTFDGTAYGGGAHPRGGLIADAAGNLFGTMAIAGTSANGGVFEIAKVGGSYASTATVLVSFDGTNGNAPAGGLIADAAGDLFGTTMLGGADGDGTVFEIVKTGGSYASTPTILASFSGNNGLAPQAGLVADAAGNLFGTTAHGGANTVGSTSGDGTLFEIPKAISGYGTLTTLVNFSYYATGASPLASLIVDAAGNLFGSTDVGGSGNYGTLFELPYIDGSYASTPTALASFSGTSVQQFPASGLIADVAGNLFGTASFLSPNGSSGTVFELSGTGFQVPRAVPGFAAVDTTTGRPIVADIQAYTGPVSGLQNEYINITSDSLNMSASTPNWFIHSGSGDDAIAVSSGTNVLDGSTGSNFLTGGTGADTFFVDDRGPTADIWSTANNFQAGDAATIWGVTAQDFGLAWVDGQGAAGFTGLTLHATASGRPTASLTLAGYSHADMADGRLSISFGSDPASGSAYMYVHGNG
jgi:uncharacterized repeat protein (TIGR03803 family)